jgi:ATP/maltotriose-dependent transcriptional regulator MalT
MVADRATALGADDLERLATAAYLVGRETEFHGCLERAHHAHLNNDDSLRAVRCAFWLGLTLLLRGEPGQASGWLTRAQRLVDGRDCVEQGYLMVPLAERQLRQGQAEAARATAAAAVEIGVRFGDADLSACARHVLGRVLLGQEQVQAGLASLDEAMLAVISGECSPIMTGLIYCSVIACCQQVHASGRAIEWTAALARWCDRQPGLVAFTGACLVHRAEIMQLRGAWPDAMAEAQRACVRFSEAGRRTSPAEALYRQAELHRLRGDVTAAEQAYRHASQSGSEPQPGLALLRLEQGRIDEACAAIRRVVGTSTDRLQRAALLPAYIEIMLAAGDVLEARRSCGELQDIASKLDSQVLQAMAAHAQGAVELAQGDAHAALGPLRRAFELWQQVEAPYEAACVRVLMGRACSALGDAEAGRFAFDAARAVFVHLGAAPAIARLDSIGECVAPPQQHPLSRRELQVLRLVAAGKTNKAIATELCLSERTIDRHVSNIYSKLNVPSRAAATAHAYDHKLL